MGAEKALVSVNKGQDPYNVIGNYISNHVTAIEDIIAVIKINGVITNELYMVDMDTDPVSCFFWPNDWWEGEEDVALLDFFPVSDAERIKWIPCSDSDRLPKDDLISRQAAIDGVKTLHDIAWKNWHEPTLSPNAVLDMLMELPSAQPEQNIGRWIFDGNSYKCNKCGAVYGWWADSQTSNYCPNCGKIMEDGQDEND